MFFIGDGVFHFKGGHPDAFIIREAAIWALVRGGLLDAIIGGHLDAIERRPSGRYSDAAIWTLVEIIAATLIVIITIIV